MSTPSLQRYFRFSRAHRGAFLIFAAALMLLGSSAQRVAAQDIRVKILTMTSCNETDNRIFPAGNVSVQLNSANISTDSNGYAVVYLRPGVYEVRAYQSGNSFAYVDRRNDNVRFRPDSRGIATVPLSSNEESLEIRMLSCGGSVGVSSSGVVVAPGAVVVAPNTGGISVSAGGASIAVGVAVKKARLTSVSNNVEVQLNNGSWIRGYEGLEVSTGDRVRTGYNSSVSLRFWDGHLGQLRPRSQVWIRGNGAALSFGEMRVTIGPPRPGPSDFEVSTTACTVGVRGTIFTVMHDETPQSSIVWVEDGVVVVTPTSASLGSVTLHGGEEARVTTSYISPVMVHSATAAVVTVDAPLLTGVWLTSTGDTIQLTQAGNRVTGTYRGVLGNGTINGMMDGRTFRGTVTIGQGMSSTSGNVTLTLMPDGRLDGTVSSVVFNGPWVLTRGR